MAKPAAILQVEGMKELRKACKQFSDDNGWRAPLRDVYREAAAMVAEEGRSRARRGAPTLAGTPASMGSRAIASIQGKGTTTEARIEAFKGVPWGPGWNFGSKGAYRQFPAKRVPDYNLYAAVEDKRQQIIESFADRIADALENEFTD